MGFLSKIFGTGPKVSGQRMDEPATLRHEGQRPVSKGFEDVFKGYRFLATLQPSVPLWILEKHGESNPGPESELPMYGERQHGIWMPVAKTWEELGIPGAKEMEDSMMASAVGHIPEDGGEFLPFLKDFRRIAESASGIEDKMDQVRNLLKSNPTYGQYGQSLGFGDPGRLLLHLGWQVCSLPFNAEALFDAGYRSMEDLRAASDEELLTISGLGQKKLEKIRQALSQN